jgi:hypothetical protein
VGALGPVHDCVFDCRGAITLLNWLAHDVKLYFTYRFGIGHGEASAEKVANFAAYTSTPHARGIEL